MQQRIFISFSGKDDDFVRKLFARLNAQPLDIWDYSDEGDEIPGGAYIGSFLNDRIDLSDFFIPVVSSNSFESEYTRGEVSHALIRYSEGKLKIIPLVSTECINRNWPEPYDKLKGLIHYRVNFSSRTSLENAIMRICNIIQVNYVPLIPLDPRLPFMDRFDEEIKKEIPHRDDGVNDMRNISIYKRLQRIQADFTVAYEKGDFAKALAKIDFFIATRSK